MRIPEQVKRLAVVIGVIVAGVLVTRFYVIPRSLVSTELHRSTTVERELAKPVKFAGSETCQGCHEEVGVKKNKSFHRNLVVRGVPRAGGAARRRPGGREAAGAARPEVLPGLPRLRRIEADGLPADQSDRSQPPQAVHRVPQPARPDAARDARGPARPATRRSSGRRRCPATRCWPARRATRCPSSTRRRRGPRCRPSRRRASSAPSATGRTRRRRSRRRSTSTTHGTPYLCWQCHYPHLPEGRG